MTMVAASGRGGRTSAAMPLVDSAAHAGGPFAVRAEAAVSIPLGDQQHFAGRREADGAAFDWAERQPRFAERGPHRAVNREPCPVNADRAERDMLDQGDHHWPGAALGVAK